MMSHIIPDVDICIMSVHKFAIYLADNLWDALVTIGTIAAAWAAFYAARVSLSIREQERIEKMEEQKENARLFATGLYVTLNELNEILKRLCKNIPFTKDKYLESKILFEKLKGIYLRLPEPTAENITLLKPLNHNIASEIFKIRATLAPVCNYDGKTTFEILKAIEPIIAPVLSSVKDALPNILEESKKSEKSVN